MNPCFLDSQQLLEIGEPDLPGISDEEILTLLEYILDLIPDFLNRDDIEERVRKIFNKRVDDEKVRNLAVKAIKIAARLEKL